MSCEYKKYIDNLLDGKLSEDKMKKLKEHAKVCEECSNELKRIQISDKIIINQLSNYPYVSSKDKIMEQVKNKNSIWIKPILYKSRKYICGVAAVIVLVFSIQFLKPYLNDFKYNVENKNTNTVNTPAIPANTNNDNKNQDPLPIDVHNLKFVLPTNWNIKINEYNSINFYENGKQKGNLLIAKIDKNRTLLQNITPNHSKLISQENIDTQLGKGILAIFEVSSPAASPTEYATYEMNAIVPINDDQGYSSGLVSPKKFTDEDKNLFINLLKQVHY